MLIKLRRKLEGRRGRMNRLRGENSSSSLRTSFSSRFKRGEKVNIDVILIERD